MVWQCVSHNLMLFLFIFIYMSIKLFWFQSFAWCLCLTCYVHINFFMIVWFISVLIWNFYSWCPIVITFVCLCLILIGWWICLMIWLWSFLGHVLTWLNVLHVEHQLLFWLFSFPLTLVFALVVCTHQFCLCFRYLALMVGLLIIWDASCFDY